MGLATVPDSLDVTELKAAAYEHAFKINDTFDETIAATFLLGMVDAIVIRRATVAREALRRNE
jgi:hypothetical protein